ncbi:MAG: UDP-N-acetylglucosamine 1-carboxyvinyltransferase [Eubacteriales bacterium]|nr:UDP-N-acetylglucosamine 1-carboxyvinyltransferase [Eubacteriales bacterium]
MEKLIIEGGTPLEGTVRISGAKNAVLPILAASLLANSPCYIHDVPDLADVETMVQVLASLGVKVERDGDTIMVNAEKITSVEAPYHYVRKMRASFLVMGPLLARLGEARIFLPGGCAIGVRPIDLHLKGFEALGAKIEMEQGFIRAKASRLKGNHIYLDFPSVGATENIMMAATLAEGQTVIENAAEEPEVVDLANFINAMGGRVKGAGTKVIRIDGVESLRGARHTVIPDRVEAGTFMVAAAITGGRVRVENVIVNHVKPVMAKLREAGVIIEEEENGLLVQGTDRISPVDIKTLPYPGFPTDMQPQMMALLTLADGNSLITETVFENRFMHVDELRRMGAKIKIEGHTAFVEGVEYLSGAPVKATDLRAGAALVLAGLAARGTTEVGCLHHIDRGYERLEEKLQQLGAKIKRVRG